MLRYLKAGGDLTDSQRRELWDKGIRFRREPGKQHTLEIVVPPGYLPAERPPQNTESAHDRWRRLNNVR